MAGIAAGIVLEIILVEVFGVIEFLRGSDFGDEFARPFAAGFGFGNDLLPSWVAV